MISAVPMRRVLPLLAVSLSSLLAGCATAPSSGTAPAGREADDVFRKGEGQYLQAQYAAAARTFRGFTDRFPGNPREPEARYWLGCSLMVLENEPEARRELEAVLASRATEDLKSRARGGLGDLARQRENYAEAARQYEEASRKNPSGYRQEDYLYWLGISRIRQGDWTGGRRNLERLIAEFPSVHWVAQARVPLALPEQHFHVQVGAYRNAESARAEQAGLQRKGVRTEVRMVTVDGQPRHLLLSGSYAAFAEAAREAARIKAMGVDAFPIP